MKLIDADELKELVNWTFAKPPFSRNTILHMIDMARRVDAEPVKHGEWIIRDNPGTGWYRVTCSECGEDVTSTAPCIGFFPSAKVLWNYCPYCGAKMRDE